MRPVYALFIHGVGTQDSHFSDDAQLWLAQGLQAHGGSLYARACHWAPLMDLTSTAFLEDARKRGHAENPITKLVTNTLSDALAYRNDRPVADKIRYLIDYEVQSLRGEPVVIFAHSLGGLIMADYLRSRTELKVEKLVTFGCNIPLFYLGAEFYPPAQTAHAGTWTNCFYHDDCLGYPLAGVSHLEYVVDMKIEPAPGIHFSDVVPGLTHVDYFGDKRFWRETAPKILGFPTK